MKKCLLFVPLLFLASAAEIVELNPPPNIVLILADDLGYADLSSFGSDDMATPHIDRLAENGMRFDNFYANSSVCSPTRASLLSGRYPPMAGVPGVIRSRDADSWGNLSEDIVLLPQMLKRAAYHTGMVGKWHLGLEEPDRPSDRGFDYFKGFLGDMMDDYYTHRRHGINYMRENESAIQVDGHATDLFSSWAVDYINSRSPSSAPFFLFLSYNAPHTPIQPPDNWVEKVKSREPGITEDRARLVALIEHMDAGIGTVVSAIEQNGFSENTLVVFVSDNGGQLNVGANNGDLRDGKQSMYEGGLKVPAVFSLPAKIKVGSKSKLLASTMDIYTTLIDAAGIPIKHLVDGQSFLPTLKGQEQDWSDRTIFFSRREGNFRYNGKTVEAVRKGDWKLLQNSPFTPLELYNLANDPSEQTDLSESDPEKFKEMAVLLRSYIRESGKVAWK